MQKIIHSIKHTNFWIWLMIATCITIPLNNDFSAKVLVCSYVYALTQIKKKTYTVSFFAFLCTVYFIWQAIQIGNSDHISLAIKEFERKSSFLLLPLLWIPLGIQFKNKITLFFNKFFPFTAAFLCLILVSQGLMEYEASDKISNLFYHNLVQSINANAIYLSCFLTISLLVLLNNNGQIKNLSKIILILVHLGTIYLLASKMYWVITLLLLVYQTIKSHKKTAQYLILSLIVLAGIAISQTGEIHKRFQKIIETPLILEVNEISEGTQFTGVNLRVYLSQKGIEIATRDLKTLFFGVGIGDAQSILNQKMKSDNLYLGTPERKDTGFLNYNFHNQYIQTLTESGFIGLILLINLLASLIVFGIKTKNKPLVILNLIFSIAFISESYLNRYMGILMFLAFNSILLVQSYCENLNRIILKRVVDFIVSFLVILFLLSWLLPILGFILWIDNKQNPIFIQKRVGYKTRTFNCYKLRTMTINADADILIAQINDSRITKTGHFFRKYGLDELPQFINVLKGEMSIIGPRPLMISEEQDYSGKIQNFSSRLEAKPGITGLSQSLGKKGYVNSIYDIRERYKIDKLYLKRASFFLDLKILFSTIINMYLKKH